MLRLLLALLLMQGPAALIDRALTDLVEAKRQLLATQQPSTTVTVPAGGNAQAAIDAAPMGTTIALTGGAAYGALQLRGDAKALVTTGTLRAVTPQLTITGNNWLVKGLEVTSAANDLVSVTGTNVTIENNYIHGPGAKRGIALNGAHVTVINNQIVDINRAGQESQGIAGWNGPGPFRIENNLISAAGINVFFGGSDPSTTGLIPSDIIIRGNVLTKDPNWKGKGFAVKNLLELKNARRVQIDNNVMENAWTDGQTGYGVLFSVRNQDGACTWCTVEDVVFTKNIIRNVGSGFSILGTDYSHPSGRATRISIIDNDLTLCTTTFPGAARMFFINDGPDALTIKNNRTATCPGGYVNSFLSFDQPTHQLVGLVVEGNLFQEGEYGVFGGSSPGLGILAWDFYAPFGIWTNNTVVKYPNGRTIKYPAGTTMTSP